MRRFPTTTTPPATTMRTPPPPEPSTTALEPDNNGDDENRDKVDDEFHETSSRMMMSASSIIASSEQSRDDHPNNEDEPAAAAQHEASSSLEQQLEVVLVGNDSSSSSSSSSSPSTISSLHRQETTTGENSSTSNSQRQKFLVHTTNPTTTTTIGDDDDVEAGTAADKLNETAMTTTSESDDDDDDDDNEVGEGCRPEQQARKESPLLLSEQKSPLPLTDEEAVAPSPSNDQAAEAIRRRWRHQKSLLLVRIFSAVFLLTIFLTLSFTLQERWNDKRPNANANAGDSSYPGLSSSTRKPGPDGDDNSDEANDNDGEEERHPESSSSSSWWADDETFYNIGGPAIGQWWQSDEDIFVSSSSSSSDATIVRVCNDTATNAFCTVRQARLLTFHFADTNSTTDEPMFLHLYFLRNEDVDAVMMQNNTTNSTSNINNTTSNINNTTSSAYYEPFTVNVDGFEWSHDDDLALSWSSRSTFVVTVPLGNNVQVRALGRPPLLAVMVLSSNGQAAGPVPDRNVASPTSQPMVQEDEPTTTHASSSNGSTDGSSSAPTLPPHRLLKLSKTAAPTAAAAASPSSSPKPAAPTTATYVPGDLVMHDETGLNLSRGLTARILARANEMVPYANGGKSTVPFHTLPDAGATYPITAADDPSGEGGWIYVSNSEVKPHTKGKKGVDIKGGVGAIRFNRQGEILHYQLVLNGTIMNCGGGRTPWGAWISGEEVNTTGRIWQVDPTGRRPAQPLPMGDVHSGLFESFAYDVRDRARPHFYMTQDDWRGALRRFTPTDPDWDNPWSILLGNGTIDYLTYQPIGANNGTFQWTSDFAAAAATAFDHFPNSEGIDVIDGQLLFVTKRWKSLHILDLDRGTYHNVTTRSGLLAGQPDQIERIFESSTTMTQHQQQQHIYFTEDGDKFAGIHARTADDGQTLTIVESPNHSDETTGLSFSPDGQFMYFAYQDEGILFEVKRLDGLPFHADVLDVKYHNK